MNAVDAGGQELHEGARVVILRDIQMERLFAGYNEALAGAAVPRDLAPGDEGEVVGTEYTPDPMLIVEFRHQGRTFWRGFLRPDEIRLKAD